MATRIKGRASRIGFADGRVRVDRWPVSGREAVSGFCSDRVVVSHDAAVRTGPLEDLRTAFTVHDGAELSVLDQKDDWLQVSAGGQWLGWLKRDQAVALSRR